MKCQKCGQEVSSQNRFCPQCGSKLEPYFFWDIRVEFNSETMEKSKIVQGEKIVLDSEAMVEELKKAEARVISLYSSMNIDDVDSIRRIRDQIQEISRRYNIACTIVEELDYRLRKAASAAEEKMQTEKSDSNKHNEDTKGIFVEGSFEDVQKLVEKDEKHHSTVLGIIIGVSLIVLFFEGRAIVTELMTSIGNKWAMFGVLLDLMLCIMLDALGIYVIWRISSPFIVKRKEKISDACLGLIMINDVQALYEAMEALKLKNCKKIFYDEHGHICVAGKYGTYKLAVNEGKVSGYKSFDVRDTLEFNTMIISLLKQLDYQAPINAYNESRKNKFWMRFGRNIKAVLVLSLVLSVGGVLVQHDFQYIDMVQNVGPETFDGISYKKAFNAYFTDRKWKHFESTDQENVVEFDGKGIYDGEEADVKIQFILTEKDENLYNIELGAIMVDEEVLGVYDKGMYIVDIFERYEKIKTK